MFVRWQTRPKTQHRRSEHWAAILASNTRINGKPTHKHIAYLGGITKADAKNVERRIQFWDKATEQLDRLRVAAKERLKIAAALVARVPRPTKDELKRHSRTQRRKAELAEPPHILALEDEFFDLEMEMDEARERA